MEYRAEDIIFYVYSHRLARTMVNGWPKTEMFSFRFTQSISADGFVDLHRQKVVGKVIKSVSGECVNQRDLFGSCNFSKFNTSLRHSYMHTFVQKFGANEFKFDAI